MQNDRYRVGLSISHEACLVENCVTLLQPLLLWLDIGHKKMRLN